MDDLFTFLDFVGLPVSSWKTLKEDLSVMYGITNTDLFIDMAINTINLYKEFDSDFMKKEYKRSNTVEYVSIESMIRSQLKNLSSFDGYTYYDKALLIDMKRAYYNTFIKYYFSFFNQCYPELYDKFLYYEAKFEKLFRSHEVVFKSKLKKFIFNKVLSVLLKKVGLLSLFRDKIVSIVFSMILDMERQGCNLIKYQFDGFYTEYKSNIQIYDTSIDVQIVKITDLILYDKTKISYVRDNRVVLKGFQIQPLVNKIMIQYVFSTRSLDLENFVTQLHKNYFILRTKDGSSTYVMTRDGEVDIDLVAKDDIDFDYYINVFYDLYGSILSQVL